MKQTTKTGGLLRAAVAAGVLALTFEVQAQDAATREVIQQLQKRIEELEQKVQALQGHTPATAPVVTNAPVAARQPGLAPLERRVQELEARQEETARTNAALYANLPNFRAGSDGLNLKSPDGWYDLRLAGVLQVDSRTFFGNSAIVGNDGFLLRRARPILEGTVAHDVDFLFVPDFGGSTPQIYDAYVNYRVSPALQLQAGKFKSPIGLEQLQSDRDLSFNERSLATDLVPNRDVGFLLHGDLLSGRLNYSAGVLNGVGDARISGNSPFQDDKEYVARLFAQPFKTDKDSPLRGLGLGVAGSFATQQATNTSALPATTGGTLAGFSTVGQQQFFAYNPTGAGVVTANGDHWRISPQGYYYWGPLSLLGEFVVSDQEVHRSLGAGVVRSARLENTAWEIAGGWVLTGEEAAFAGGVTPRHPFDPFAGRWGAWQVVARYSELNVDHNAFPTFANPASSANAAHEWSVGLNWYLNKNVKLAASFAHTIFDGGGTGASVPGIVNHKDENVLFTRLQLAF